MQSTSLQKTKNDLPPIRTERYSVLLQRVHNVFSPLFDSLAIEIDKLLLQLMKFFCANHLIFHHPIIQIIQSAVNLDSLNPPHDPGTNAQQPLNAERLRSAKVRQSLPLQSSALNQLESPCSFSHKLMGLQTTDVDVDMIC